MQSFKAVRTRVVVAVVAVLAVALAAGPALAAGWGRGMAWGGTGRTGIPAQRQMGPMMGPQAMLGLDTVAKLLGEDPATIAAERQGGKSLAEIAAARGVSEEALVQALLDAHRAALDAAAAAGRITREQADAMLGVMGERIAQAIHRTDTGPFGRGFGRGAGLGRGARHGVCPFSNTPPASDATNQ